MFGHSRAKFVIMAGPRWVSALASQFPLEAPEPDNRFRDESCGLGALDFRAHLSYMAGPRWVLALQFPSEARGPVFGPTVHSAN